jgi:hypothetical protein
MYKVITTLLLGLLCSAVPQLGMAQVITHAEYYIDTDPGIGQATPISGITSSDSITHVFNITIPIHLSSGRHLLYTRTFSNTGKVSLAEPQVFYVTAALSQIEYYIDTDPGIGNGTLINTASTSDSLSLNTNITLPPLLAPGTHTLHTRSIATNGSTTHNIASMAQATSFYVSNTIVKAEYFFDTDPGYNLGTAIPISIQADSIIQNAAIAVPNNLSAGTHVLYTRTLTSDGMWSATHASTIFVTQSITAAEYFVDTDPGIGLGTPITITTTSDSIAQNVNINTSAISNGHHILYIRTRTANGRWSIAQGQAIYVQPKVIAVAYRYDAYTGINNTTIIPLNTPADSVTQTVGIPVPCNLSMGKHYVSIHTIDNQNAWSLYSVDSIIVTAPPPITLGLSSAAPPCSTTNGSITANASGGYGAPFTFALNNGSYGTSNIFTTVLPYNIYTVSTKDAQGCITTSTSNVPNYFGLQVSASALQDSVIVNTTAQLTATAANDSSSASPITYLWAGPNAFSNNNAIASFTCNTTHTGIYTITASNSFGCTATATTSLVILYGIHIAPKVMLAGNYNSSTGLMHDSLRYFNLIPLQQPYGIGVYQYVGSTSSELTNTAILATTGNNAIVDWVQVQLRNPSNPSQIIASKSALLQRDGDVVSASDGVSALWISNADPDNYLVSIVHRNHLGVMMANPIALNYNTTAADFTLLSTPLYSKPAPQNNTSPLSGPTRIIAGKRCLYAGNCNINSTLSKSILTYNASLQSDRLAMLLALGVSSTVNGYSLYDCDMNGFARFNGFNPDRLIILSNLANSNTLIGYEQLP